VRIAANRLWPRVLIMPAEYHPRSAASTVVGARTPSLFSRTLAQHTALVVAAHPHREALVVADTGSRQSFGSLHAKALAFARVLQRHGLGSGDRVAVWLRNGEEWVVTLLACAAAQVRNPTHHGTRAPHTAASSDTDTE
jgi:long-subunit acyl-CoA synthetase (AMP-forming)